MSIPPSRPSVSGVHASGSSASPEADSEASQHSSGPGRVGGVASGPTKVPLASEKRVSSWLSVTS